MLTRNHSSPDCAILSLTVDCPLMCAFYSPPEGVKFLCGTAEAPSRFPFSRLRVFTQVGRGGWGSFIDELCGHQHDSHLGAKPSRLSTSEESIIIHNPYPLSLSISEKPITILVYPPSQYRLTCLRGMNDVN